MQLRKTWLAVSGAMLALSIISSMVHAEDSPNPNEVFIRDVSASGNGCQTGTVSAVLTQDRKTLSILFDHYVSEVDGSRSLSDRRSCDITLDLNIPPGWSYTLMTADYRGYANLDPGTMGTQEIIYSFDPIRMDPSPGPMPPPGRRPPIGRPPGFGAPPVVLPTTATFSAQTLRGPYSSDYAFRNLNVLGSVVWSPCSSAQKPLRISTAILTRVLQRNLGSSAKATMTLDSMDSSLTQNFSVRFRRCY